MGGAEWEQIIAGTEDEYTGFRRPGAREPESVLEPFPQYDLAVLSLSGRTCLRRKAECQAEVDEWLQQKAGCLLH